MATEIRRRRGSTTQHATFTGAPGELTVDTTLNTVVVHDGITAGGHPLAKAIGTITATNVPFTPVGDIVATDVQTALEEIDTEKQPLDSTLTAISGDTLGAFSHRNKIINGGFAVNQRVYVSGAAVGAGLYGHDRWKMAASADTYTFSTTANKTTVTIPTGKVLRQVIEGLNLQSGTYVLSWEGTAQAKIGAGALGASPRTGSITGGTDTTIEFTPGTVANVQLEFGSLATPFEHRPIGTEELLCKRYYERIGYTTPVGGSQYPIYAFRVTKRVSPTLAIVSGSNNGAVDNGIDSLNSMRQSVLATTVTDVVYSASSEL